MAYKMEDPASSSHTRQRPVKTVKWFVSAHQVEEWVLDDMVSSGNIRCGYNSLVIKEWRINSCGPWKSLKLSKIIITQFLTLFKAGLTLRNVTEIIPTIGRNIGKCNVIQRNHTTVTNCNEIQRNHITCTNFTYSELGPRQRLWTFCFACLLSLVGDIKNLLAHVSCERGVSWDGH